MIIWYTRGWENLPAVRDSAATAVVHTFIHTPLFLIEVGW
jgi:hypothetical protein